MPSSSTIAKRCAAVQSGEMGLQFEWSTVIGSDDFVDAVAELKPSVFDRHCCVSQPKKPPVDKRDFRHDQAPLGAEELDTVT